MVPLQARPTVLLGALASPDGQALEHPPPTTATVLAGIGRRHGGDSLPGAFCLESEDGKERTPPRIRDTLSQGVILDHVGRLHVLVIDHIELLHQLEGFLVVEVLPLPRDMLMRFGQQHDRLAASMAAPLAAPPLAAHSGAGTPPPCDSSAG
jgi:hypothetical protein